MSQSNDQNGRESGMSEGNVESDWEDVLDFLVLFLIAPLITIGAIVVGVFAYRIVPQIGFIGAGIVGVASVFAVFMIIRESAAAFIRRVIRAFAPKSMKRASSPAPNKPSQRPRSGLRQRLIDMGVRSKDDPPPGSGINKDDGQQ